MPSSVKPPRRKVDRSCLTSLLELSDAELTDMALSAEADLVALTVTEGTRTLYMSRVRLLEEILDDVSRKRVEAGKKAFVWDERIFIIFLKKMADLKMGYSGSGYLNAILFAQKQGKFYGTWAIDNAARFRHLVKGAAYQAGEARHCSKRAQMTLEMFESFCEFLIEEGMPASMVAAMQVAFWMALRISECLRLRHQDVMALPRVNGEGCDYVLDLPNKAYKAGTAHPPRVQKPLVAVEAMSVIFSAKVGKKTGDLLFPRAEWDEKTVRAMVKAWAEEHALKFTAVDNVFFDGAHTLRHGGMARIREQVQDAMSRTLMAGLAGCSAENVVAYSTTNEERGRKGLGKKKKVAPPKRARS